MEKNSCTSKDVQQMCGSEYLAIHWLDLIGKGGKKPTKVEYM